MFFLRSKKALPQQALKLPVFRLPVLPGAAKDVFWELYPNTFNFRDIREGNNLQTPNRRRGQGAGSTHSDSLRQKRRLGRSTKLPARLRKLAKKARAIATWKQEEKNIKDKTTHTRELKNIGCLRERNPAVSLEKRSVKRRRLRGGIGKKRNDVI